MFVLSKDNLDTARLSADLKNERAGALATFEGWVRNHNEGHQVTLLEYQAYPQLALSEGEKIIRDACEKFDIIEARCVHRTGSLAIGDIAVWVGVISCHRKEAFAACRFIIDAIKHRVPIWKKEHYVNGTSGWVNCGDHDTGNGITRYHINEGCLDEEALYSEQVKLEQVGTSGQAALKRSKVLIAGAGGLGCSAMAHLASAGIGGLGICDFAQVELRHLHRQFFFSPEELGARKVEVAARQVRRINPLVKVNPLAIELSNENVDAVIADYDLILDCTNRLSSNYLIGDACVRAGKPLISAGVNGFLGRMFVYIPDHSRGCFRCAAGGHEELLTAATSRESLGASAGYFGTMQAIEAVKLILKLPVVADKVLSVDLMTFDVQSSAVTLDANCLACAYTETAGVRPASVSRSHDLNESSSFMTSSKQ